MPPGADTPELLAGVLRSLGRGVLVQGDDGRVVAANPAFCAALGLDVPADELIGLAPTVLEDALAPLLADVDDFVRRSREITGAGAAVAGELVHLGDGRIVARSYRPLDLDGARVHVWEVDDVTAEAAEHERLRASEMQLGKIFEEGPLGICVVDAGDFTLLRCNQRFGAIVGYAPAELIGKPFAEITHPEDVDADVDLAARLFRGEIPLYKIIKRYIHKAGHDVWVELTATVIRDEAGAPLFGLGLIEDISDRRRAETRREELAAQLRQQQKLEAIGVLASGVAHEINNPVQGVISHAELLRKRLGDDPRAGNMVDRIIRECDRIATIVRNLLAFSRQEPSRRRAVTVCDIVDGTFSLIGALLRRDGIHISLDVEDGLPAVHCHGQQIQQVLMNLVTNARDALNERYPEAGGDKQLVLRARRLATASGDWVELIVEDRGIGIDDDIAERIFDPFFTTKDGDKGTGLGLSVSHGIVAEHGGELWMECADGWTRFHLELPAAPGAPLPPRAK